MATTTQPRIIDHFGAYGDHALAVLSFLFDAAESLEDSTATERVDAADAEIRETFRDLEDDWGSTDAHGARWEIQGIPTYERAEEGAEATVAAIVADWTALTGQTLHVVKGTRGDTWHVL